MQVDGRERRANGRFQQSFSFDRATNTPSSSTICKYYQIGTCSFGQTCKFIHPGTATRASGASNNISYGKRGGGSRDQSDDDRNGRRESGGFSSSRTSRKVPNPCKFWLAGHCRKGDTCQYLHAHTSAQDVEMMMELKGHTKGIRGIAFLPNTNQLCSGSQDGTLRVWDCSNEQTVHEVNVGGEVECLLYDSGCLFVGLDGQVKIFELGTGAQTSLVENAGKVNSLSKTGEFLFAGCQNGNILAWRFNATTSSFDPVVSLTGHSAAVTALQIAPGRLYSGSIDMTIRVWDLTSGQCVQTVDSHKNAVTSFLPWESYLLSCSLDGTIKVWSMDPVSGVLEVVFSYPEPDEKSRHRTPTLPGVLAMAGCIDHNQKPLLLVSCTDDSVRILQLPTFEESGAMYSKEVVRVVHVAAVGQASYAFTGNAAGDVKVWRWREPPVM